jgi:hypothetical protein
VKKSANETKPKRSSKRRAESSTGSSVDSLKAPASIGRSEASGDDDDTRATIERAIAGDESVTDAARALVNASAPLARFVGEMAGLVERGWVRRLAGQNILAREAMTLELARLKARLLGPTPTAIEQVLIDRVAACWVQANYFDATEATHGDRTFGQAELALKRQTMAHKRLLSALKTLAEVRRLMVPSVQVNIAEQQVNLAGESR